MRQKKILAPVKKSTAKLVAEILEKLKDVDLDLMMVFDYEANRVQRDFECLYHGV